MVEHKRHPAAVVLFTRDLRVHDQPALAAAVARAERVVPLFVLDDGLLHSTFAVPNRLAFLLESLRDLDGALQAMGGGLMIRRGDTVREVVGLAQAVGAGVVHASADVSAYAQRRQHRLARACREVGLELALHPGVMVVDAGRLAPASGNHFRVFTPYWARWRTEPLRALASRPRRVVLPGAVDRGQIPTLKELTGDAPSPSIPKGGETEGRRRLDTWLRSGLAHYGERHDDLAADGTSRLSPYVHFGCLSPVEVARRAADRDGGEAFLRQLCWRDFHHQVTAAFPRIARADYRPRGDVWNDDAAVLAAWREGRTGYPLVDAGMRQLRAEGWMHNRARLVTASFLVKDLHLDWRAGAAHFFELLVDGDIANNAGNWQWVAGTGNDARPERLFNPVRQSHRFDPHGDYIRRWLPELATLGDARVHEPWRLDATARGRLGYVAPIVDHAEAAAAVRARGRTARRAEAER